VPPLARETVRLPPPNPCGLESVNVAAGASGAAGEPRPVAIAGPLSAMVGAPAGGAPVTTPETLKPKVGASGSLVWKVTWPNCGPPAAVESSRVKVAEASAATVAGNEPVSVKPGGRLRPLVVSGVEPMLSIVKGSSGPVPTWAVVPK